MKPSNPISEELFRAASQEAARLTSELRIYPAFRKLEAVRSVLDAYATENPDNGGPSSGAADEFQEHATRKAQGRSSGSKSAAIVREARAYLLTVGRRAESSQIAEALRGRGIEILKGNPTSVVSSYLSQSDLFDNVRGQGYGLVEWTERDTATNGSQTNDGPSDLPDDKNTAQGTHSESSSSEA
jgi:hypothetical protein